jgi:hypothetical protein
MATLLTLGGLLGVGNTASAESTLSFLAPEKEMSGVIQSLDFGANTMIFEGIRYRMAPDVQVEIRGSYGAFTMLEEGMKAIVTYRLISASEREVVKIEQLPDNVRLEGA